MRRCSINLASKKIATRGRIRIGFADMRMRDTRARSVRMSADAAVTPGNVFRRKAAIDGFARGLKRREANALKVRSRMATVRTPFRPASQSRHCDEPAGNSLGYLLLSHLALYCSSLPERNAES